MPLDLGLGVMARIAEDAGAHSLWVSDHVALFRETRSRYPYSVDGSQNWSPDVPWLETFAALSWLAATTSVATVGSAVLVLPQRHPVLVAKAAASIDALSGGRVVLGVGAGWLAEEFELLGWSFEDRTRRLEEAVAVLRACWSGSPSEFHGEFFDLPAGVLCYPRPSRDSGIPVLIGGMTTHAAERAGRIGDGWLALARLRDFDPSRIESLLERAHSVRPAGKQRLRTVLSLIGAVGDADVDRVERAARIGFDEVAIDVTWDDLNAAQATIASVCSALG